MTFDGCRMLLQSAKLAAANARPKAQRGARLVVRAEEQEAERGQAADQNKEGTGNAKVQKVTLVPVHRAAQAKFDHLHAAWQKTSS